MHGIREASIVVTSNKIRVLVDPRLSIVRVGQVVRSASARSARQICVFGIVCALAACANYEAKPLQPAATAQAFAARRLDTPELGARIAVIAPQAATPWPPHTFDRAALLAVALGCNEKLAVARAQARAARVHEGAVAQPANPDLTLQSEYARHDPHPWLYGFALDFTLRSPAIKNLQTELARLGTSNADWQLLDAVWTQRRGIVAALSDHEAARRRIALLDRLGAAQDRLIGIEEKRVAAGEDAPGELLTSRQARIEITQQRAHALTSLDAAQAALAAALGVPPQALDGINLDWPEWGEPPSIDAARLNESREQALLSRSDLAAAIGDYAQSENKLQQAVARQYPQLHLTPGYYWDHGVAKLPFDVGFTPPLFNRGEIAEARAERDVVGARMLALQAEIYDDIAAAERADHTALASTEAAQSSLQGLREQERRAQLGLRLGALGHDEIVAAEILVLRGELEILDARAQLQAARDALEDALHAPLSGPELALSRNLSGNVVESSR